MLDGDSLTESHFSTSPNSHVQSAVATLHTDPVSLDVIVVDVDQAWRLHCINPRPMRALMAFAEGIGQLHILDRNAAGSSLEFGRFDVQLFIGDEMTERFDCDRCDIEMLEQ